MHVRLELDYFSPLTFQYMICTSNFKTINQKELLHQMRGPMHGSLIEIELDPKRIYIYIYKLYLTFPCNLGGLKVAYCEEIGSCMSH